MWPRYAIAGGFGFLFFFVALQFASVSELGAAWWAPFSGRLSILKESRVPENGPYFVTVLGVWV